MVAKQAEDIKKGISLNKNANQEQIIDQYKILMIQLIRIISSENQLIIFGLPLVLWGFLQLFI